MTWSDGQVYRVDVLGDFDGTDDIVNTYQMKQISVSDVATEDVIADVIDFIEALYAILKQIQTAESVWRRIRVQAVPSLELLGEEALDPVIEGTKVGNALPSQCTYPMAFKTTTPNVILRKFWGPGASGNLTAAGKIDSTAMTLLASAADLLMTVFEGTYLDLEYGYQSPIALAWKVPTVAVYSNVFGAVRSRRVGVGS